MNRMKKQVKIDKHYIGILKNRFTLDKWYDVISEWKLGYKLQDNTGLIDDCPKVWINETREVQDDTREENL